MIQTLLLLIVNFALAINIVYIKSTLIGVIFLFLYLSINGYFAGRILMAFGIDSRLPARIATQSVAGGRGNDNVIEWLLGIFITFFVISTLLGVIIAFYGYSEWVLVGVLVGVSVGLAYLGRKELRLQPFKNVFEKLKLKFHSFSTLNPRSSLTPIFLAIILLFLIGFATLISSAAPNEYITSPWQAIPANFVWVVVVLSALILGLIFFRPKKYLLIFVILFSIMQHLYIPAVYRLPYALDDWRQIGMMEKIVAEGSIAPHSIEQTFISPKMSYAPFWGAAIWLWQTLNVNLVQLTVWWQALFFSFFLPILLWILGRQLGTDILSVPDTTRRASPGHGQEVRTQPAPTQSTFSLLLAFLPALFYPLQIYGAISLPVGFSFLWFVLFLIAVVAYIKQPTTKLRVLIGITFMVMLFGYLVYWLVGLLIIGFLIVRRVKLVRIIYLFGSILFIPIVSLWASPNARFDILTTGINYAADFWKHYTQYLLGFKNLGAPRPQAGNLIFHDMRQSFVDIWPFNWQYLDTILLIVLVILLIVGVFYLNSKFQIPNSNKISNSNDQNSKLLLYLFFISIGSITIDWYYFGGIHLLTERMDLVVNLSFMLILVLAIIKILNPKSLPADATHQALQAGEILNSKRFRTFGFKVLNLFRISSLEFRVFIIIIFLSFSITATYISGPVYGRVTRPQYNAVKWLDQDMRARQRQDFCVLSEHFPLSALEAVSAGRVSNGNFPMQYGYLETSGGLFVKMFSRPNINWMKQATALAASPGCYLFIDQRHLADWNTLQLRWLLGREVYRVDGVYIWLYDMEESSR